MIPFFPSIPYVILKKYESATSEFFLYFHYWFKLTSFYIKFRLWEQEEVCGERQGLYSGCESNAVLFSAKSPRKILLGLFTVGDETSALVLNILYLDNTKENVKLKHSHNRPGVAQRVPEGLGSQISWHSAREGGEAVSFMHQPPLPPGDVPGTHFH